MKRRILFTFDYELFLGKDSGRPEKCLLEPTDYLLQLFKPFNARLIFFVDNMYLLRLFEMSARCRQASRDYDLVVEQIRHIADCGHDIFPHFHPHWLDAEYDEGTGRWNLANSTHYRFDQLEEHEGRRYFNAALKMLREVVQQDRKHTSMDGFRAGGWSLQPFGKLRERLIENGILHDFSVVPGLYAHTNAQEYDYRNAPDKGIYRFDQDLNEIDAEGVFTEFPISTHGVTALQHLKDRIWRKWLWWKGERSLGDGIGMVSVANGDKNKSKVDEKGLEMLSLELLNRSKLKAYMDTVARRNYVHFISHPKMLTMHNLKMTGRFLKHIYKHYTVETDFRKMMS